MQIFKPFKEVVVANQCHVTHDCACRIFYVSVMPPLAYWVYDSTAFATRNAAAELQWQLKYTASHVGL